MADKTQGRGAMTPRLPVTAFRLAILIWVLLGALLLSPHSRADALPKAGDVWLTVGDDPVYWDEYYFWLGYSLRAWRQQQQPDAGTAALSSPVNWTTAVQGLPLASWLKQQASRYACEQREIRRLTADHRIALQDQDHQQMQAQRLQQIRTYGSEREYLGILRRMYVSEAVYNRLQETDRLSARLFTELYGDEARHLDPAVVDEYVSQRQLRHVGYLFRARPSDPVAAQALQHQMQTVRAMVVADAHPVNRLLSLMREQGEDPVMKRFPQGRLTAASQLPAVVANAWGTLADNGISPVLETPQGWYVLARLPITATTRSNNSDHPLRYWAAYQQRFRPMVEAGCQSLPIVVTSDYDSLDLSRFMK